MNARVSPGLEAPAALSRPLVRIVIVGHVDHGKSTLVGRLLHETGSLPEGKLEMLKAVSARRGMPFEWSFLLDALQTERDQGITIDTSQIRFRTPSRDFVLIDAPGHTEFLRNMITGASQADGAVLIIDALEGVRDQPPEFWDQFNASPPPGAHLRIHPILHWTEADIWAYTKRENIPIIPLYLAHDGKRYRSLGDADITNPVASKAATIDDILIELEQTKVPERSGRALDHETEDAFERLRVAGYL